MSIVSGEVLSKMHFLHFFFSPAAECGEGKEKKGRKGNAFSAITPLCSHRLEKGRSRGEAMEILSLPPVNPQLPQHSSLVSLIAFEHPINHPRAF